MPIYALSERRKIRRVYVRIPIACEIIDPGNRAVRNKTAVAYDINPEGIYFEIDEVLLLNTELNIMFLLPKSDHGIRASIKVVRIETTGNEKNFGIGATFIQLKDEDKIKIKQFAEHLNIDRLLELTIKNNASDLHLVTDMPPVVRIRGEIEILNAPKLCTEDISILLYSIMSKQQIRIFEHEKELDFGMQYDIQNRFRINVHQQRGFIEAAFRLINTKVSSFDELNIPEVVKDLARLKDGLVLIVGPTGSGKSTTIAAMVELINQERKAVIITLERPIEYVHLNVKSIIKQREVGIDTNSFSAALKSSLRQDPNVIVVGELDDMETVKTAMIAAEAGHFVIASFHALNTIQAIDRLTNVFPPEHRKQILSQLSNCIKGVVCQLLIPRKDGQGMVLASEIVVANDAVKRIIRNDESIQLPTAIQTGAAFKMQAMQDSIKRYIKEGIVDEEAVTAYFDAFKRYSH